MEPLGPAVPSLITHRYNRSPRRSPPFCFAAKRGVSGPPSTRQKSEAAAAPLFSVTKCTPESRHGWGCHR